MTSALAVSRSAWILRPGALESLLSETALATFGLVRLVLGRFTRRGGLFVLYIRTPVLASGSGFVYLKTEAT